MEERVKVTGIAYDQNVAKITLRGVPDRPGIAAALFEPLAREGISVDTIVQNTSVEDLTDLSFTVARTELKRAVQVVEPVANSIDASALTTDDTLAKVSIVGAGMQNSPGYASRMFRALADDNINIEMITTSEIRITCITAETSVADAVRSLHRASNWKKWNSIATAFFPLLTDDAYDAILKNDDVYGQHAEPRVTTPTDSMENSACLWISSRRGQKCPFSR